MALMPVEEARTRILAHAKPLAPENVPLAQALGRALAKPLNAKRDQPPFNSSAMDGYALRSGDTMTEFNDQGVGFRSLTENIDTTTPGGRLVFHLFAALAEFERDLIRDRTKAGLAAARARGRLGGRPRALSRDQVSAARGMYDQQDMTVAQIGEVLGVSRATIYRALAADPAIGKRQPARAGG